MIIVSETVQKFILDYIRKKVKPGGRLPSEREIAKMLEVGRSSVREALQILAERGIIEKIPGKGNFLKEDFSDKLSGNFKRLLPTVDIDSSLDLLEFRRAIESENAYLTAQRCTEEVLVQLQKSIDQLKICVAAEKSIIVPDMAFHYTIAHGTQNGVLASVYDSMVDYFKKVRIEMAISDDVQKAIEYHEGMVEAIRQRDSDRSSALMRLHIEDVRQHYEKMLAELPDE
ncbi:MAG: FadR/GntR family transcriptional regulator [Sporolactobacillus sp.]